ncbi:MAG: 2-hydroxyacyl-CoA dehydratase [Dehalococcoidia bacterium]|nr:2-hydroxyacyl-CoA dehydratase [Dehalococcoidia bacterium]
MSAAERLQQVVTDRHQYAQEWKKRTGGKVVGYLCTYVPEEVFYAADILPVRIVGSHEPESVTSPYVFGMFCSYCRDCLAQGLQGRYDYLDAVSTAHCCVHSYQTFDSWKRHIPAEHFYYVSMPQLINSRGAQRSMLSEIQVLKERVETDLGLSISTAKVEQAMKVYDRNRSLMRQVYELRRLDNPPITGAQCMDMVIASQIMDKEEHSQLVEEFLKEMEASSPKRETGVRLMVAGHTDSVDVIRVIEELGTTVVADDLCFGSRYFWNTSPDGSDPLTAMARRYLERPPCPMKDLHGVRIRPQYLLEMAKNFGVQGAVLIRQQFCDPHEYDMPAVKRLLEENGIPSIDLEQDITMPLGQLRTRVEAHLELVQQEIA